MSQNVRSAGRVNFFWSTSVQSNLLSCPVRTRDHNFVLPKPFTYFQMGPLRRKEGSDNYLSLSFYEGDATVHARTHAYTIPASLDVFSHTLALQYMSHAVETSSFNGSGGGWTYHHDHRAGLNDVWMLSVHHRDWSSIPIGCIWNFWVHTKWH
jgi:hypothetical protein